MIMPNHRLLAAALLTVGSALAGSCTKIVLMSAMSGLVLTTAALDPQEGGDHEQGGGGSDLLVAAGHTPAAENAFASEQVFIEKAVDGTKRNLRGSSNDDEEQTQPRQLDGAMIYPLHDKGGNAHTLGLLGICEGDCDIDEHCDEGLKCHQRSRGQPVPGCTGNLGSNSDFCVVDPNYVPPTTTPGTTTALATTTSATTTATTTTVAATASSTTSTTTSTSTSTTITDPETTTSTSTSVSIPTTTAAVTTATTTTISSPSTTTTAPESTTTTIGVLRDYGGNAHISRPGLLGLCEGDCDIDEHCDEGLKCHQRSRGQDVPGCTGNLGSNSDYCVVDPNYVPPATTTTSTTPAATTTIPSTTSTMPASTTAVATTTTAAEDTTTASTSTAATASTSSSTTTTTTANTVSSTTTTAETTTDASTTQVVVPTTAATTQDVTTTTMEDTVTTTSEGTTTPIITSTSTASESSTTTEAVTNATTTALATTTIAGPTTTVLVEIVDYGGDAHISRPGLLGLCEGDCDIDEHCEEGLKCYQRSRGDPVPGCTGDLRSNSDYCVVDPDYEPFGCNAELASIDFLGVGTAISSQVGKLNVSWPEANVFALEEDNGFDAASCNEFEYQVFISEGTFEIENEITLEDLYSDPSLVMYTTNELKITISDLTAETYSVLVVAKLDDDWASTNPDVRQVRMSKADPVIHPNINLVSLEDSSTTAVYESGDQMSFQGSDAENLNEGDWISGLDADGIPYLVQLVSNDGGGGRGLAGQRKLQDGDAEVWTVRNGTLIDVYERLSFEVSIDVTNVLIEEDDVEGRRRLQDQFRRDLVTFVDADTTTYRIAGRKKFGPDEKASIGCEVNVKIVEVLSIEIEFGFPEILEVLDIRHVHTFSIKGKVDAQFKVAGVERNYGSTEKTLWSGPSKSFPIPVGPVQVWIKIRPFVKAFLATNFTAEVVAEAFYEAEYVSRLETTFSLEGGWNTNDDGTGLQDKADINLNGKASITAFGGIRFEIGVLVYFTAYFAPSLAIGPSLTIEATNNPPSVIADDPIKQLFHFSKLDLGLKGTFDLKAEMVRDIPFVDEESLRLGVTLFERTKPWLSMPDAEFTNSNLERCVGDSAVQITMDVREKPYNLPFENEIRAPFNFVKDIAMFDWDMEQQDKMVTLTLSRSYIEDNEFYELPGPLGDSIFFVSHTKIPPTPVFSTLFTQAILGLPGFDAFEPFDCCEEADCDLKYGEESDVEYTCEENQCSAGPTASPTNAPTPSPTPEPEDPDRGGAYGDPHMFTYDGFRYSCQGAGDFVLTKSLDSDMEIHVRFKKKSFYVTLATAIVAKSGVPGDPIVEIAISDDDDRSIHVLLDGDLLFTTLATAFNRREQYADDKVEIDINSRQFNIHFKQNGLRIENRLLLPTAFPHWRNSVLLPSSFRNERIVGLLGSNNDNVRDDWTDPSGAAIEFPNFQFGSEAYEYCITNWCIQTETESLFNYTQEFSFEYHYFCDDPYFGDVDISQASLLVRELCGLDLTCIIDGIELGIEGSQNALEAQADLVATGAAARFRFVPPTIQVSSPANVMFTVNLGEVDDAERSQVDRFNIYRLSSTDFQIISPLLVALQDNGLGVDESAGDFVFSNVLALLSVTAGESFSYTAIPVINGIEDSESPLQTTSINAVLSFSIQSGIGDNNNNNTSTAIVEDSIENLILVIDYSWPADQPDLDTGTFFLGSGEGYSCGSSPYIIFSGDNTDLGGVESARVLLGTSFEDGAWSGTASVDMNAGWYGGGGQGPASVTVYTERIDANGTVLETSGASVSFVVNPGSQRGCSSTDVGLAQISIGDDDTVTIEIFQAP